MNLTIKSVISVDSYNFDKTQLNDSTELVQLRGETRSMSKHFTLLNFI